MEYREFVQALSRHESVPYEKYIKAIVFAFIEMPEVFECRGTCRYYKVPEAIIEWAEGKRTFSIPRNTAEYCEKCPINSIIKSMEYVDKIRSIEYELKNGFSYSTYSNILREHKKVLPEHRSAERLERFKREKRWEYEWYVEVWTKDLGNFSHIPYMMQEQFVRHLPKQEQEQAWESITEKVNRELGVHKNVNPVPVLPGGYLY